MLISGATLLALAVLLPVLMGGKPWTILVALVLAVVGLPLLIVGLVRRSRQGRDRQVAR